MKVTLKKDLALTFTFNDFEEEKHLDTRYIKDCTLWISQKFYFLLEDQAEVEMSIWKTLKPISPHFFAALI